MRMIEADDILAALAALALNAHQLFGIDVVTVLRRIGAGVSGARHRSDYPCAVIIHAAEQHTAALVRIRLLAVMAKRVVMGLAEAKHRKSEVKSQKSDSRKETA